MRMARHAASGPRHGCERGVIYADPMPVISQESLPLSNIAREFVGDDHGGVGITFLLVDAEPGSGPALHQHPYEEVFIVQEGSATFELDGDELEVRAGEIVVVPPNTPHRFVSTGDGPLRQVDIHVSPRFHTEWL
jgi:mannose-6-phosphate isomerase-like protein (cupin superfamily)